MNAPLWKLEKVTLSGRGRPRLLDVSLEINPGVTAILGHSGAGKTSLLNLLVGFELADSGTITCGLMQPNTNPKCARESDPAPARETPLPASRVAVEQSSRHLPLYWAPAGDGLWPHLTVGQQVRAVLPEMADSEAKIADFLA